MPQQVKSEVTITDDLAAKEDEVTENLASDVAEGLTVGRKSQRNRYKTRWPSDYITD